MIAHLKLLIAKLQRDRFGATSERGRRLLDELELQVEELKAPTRPRTRRAGHSLKRMPYLLPDAASRCGGRCRRICRVSAW